jgi:hypothetical protein
MSSSLVAAILPYWILGVPLVVAVIIMLPLPNRGELAASHPASHHRGQRRNIVSNQPV